MKFVTPLIASEPYAADAPPVTTSTRSISAVGNIAMSMVPACWLLTTRRPSSSVSVRFAPMPRKFTEFEPPPDVKIDPVCDCALSRNCGICVSESIKSVGAISRISSFVTAVTGVGVVMPSRRRRDPVTMISSGAGRPRPALVRHRPARQAPRYRGSPRRAPR